MRHLIHIISVFSALILCAASCRNTENKREEGRFVVAMDLDMPGYFIFNDEKFGYQYELLSAYADSCGMEMVVVSENTPAKYGRMLHRGSIDAAALAGNHLPEERGGIVHIYNTSYVLLSKKGEDQRTAQRGLYEALRGGKVLISHSFSATNSYDALMDSVKSGNLYLSSRNIFELIDELGKGEYEYLVCDISEAQLAVAFMKNISIAHRFEEKVPVYIDFGITDTLRVKNFREWFSRFSAERGDAALRKLYFERGLADDLISRAVKNRKRGELSPYDSLFRKVGLEEGIDWRFIAAVAYVESKFNPYMVSTAGARGLMQVMFPVAEEFGEPRDSIMIPEINIRLGVKHLRKLERSLNIPAETGDENRMSILLASYNAGLGHLYDARALATKYGGDPNLWSDLSRYLYLKAEDEYAKDEVVTCGKFTGGQTTADFVNNVLEKYYTYCVRVKR